MPLRSGKRRELRSQVISKQKKLADDVGADTQQLIESDMDSDDQVVAFDPSRSRKRCNTKGQRRSRGGSNTPNEGSSEEEHCSAAKCCNDEQEEALGRSAEEGEEEPEPRMGTSPPTSGGDQNSHHHGKAASKLKKKKGRGGKCDDRDDDDSMAAILQIGSAAHKKLLKSSIKAAKMAASPATSASSVPGTTMTAGTSTSVGSSSFPVAPATDAVGMGSRVATADSIATFDSSSCPASPEPGAVQSGCKGRNPQQFNRFQSIEGEGLSSSINSQPATTTTAAQIAKKKATATKQLFQFLLVLDFEATCDQGDWDHEIIEFPISVVSSATKKIVAEYHSYVKPIKNPILTPFCTELTGITQEQVDAAPTLPDVLLDVRKWLRRLFPSSGEGGLFDLSVAPSKASSNRSSPKTGRSPTAPGAAVDLNAPENEQGDTTSLALSIDNGAAQPTKEQQPAADDVEELVEEAFDEADLTDVEYSEFLTKNNICCFATDGPWDMRRFMSECSVLRDGIVFPKLFYSYVNVRKAYAAHFKTKPLTLTQMLIRQGLQFQGNLHSGRDDTRNIARIAILLMERGCVLRHVSTLPLPDDEGIAIAQQMEALLAEFKAEDQARLAKMKKKKGSAQAQQTKKGQKAKK